MSEIYNIIDKQKLDIVSKPISEASLIGLDTISNFCLSIIL